jgi:hypothetical protein
MDFVIHYVAEDPWPVFFVCLCTALGALVALRGTQQGRFLVIACSALLVGALFWIVEYVWVTDAERVEQVVYDLAEAVKKADAPTVLAKLTPECTFSRGEVKQAEGKLLENLISRALSTTRFDSLTISKLRTNVGKQTRLGQANFRVFASGTTEFALVPTPFAATLTEWSLGLEETSQGVWKINRITATRVPMEVFQGTSK